MELDTAFRKVFCCGNSEEKKAIIPVDCSIILPDYFPDVMKILRYTAKTVKSPVISEGGAETVSGNVNIEVSYVSEDGGLCSCSQLQPFSHSFDCSGNVFAAEADISVGEIGCRAVNKRRIDLHGSIEAVLRIISGEEKEIISSVSGAGAVFKKEETESVIIAGEFYKGFTMEERGELGYGKPPFGKIIRSSAVGEVTECHVIQDKIVTKGEIRVRVLWAPDENGNDEKGPFLSSFVFPVSRMVDAEGILLTDTCDADYRADFPDITPADDGMSIDIKLKVGIHARVYRKEKLSFITDMFSTDFETAQEKMKISFQDDAIPFSETETVFEKIDLPETVEQVTDIWTEADSPLIDGEERIAIPLRLCMFARDFEGNPVFFEKSTEKLLDSPVKGRKIAFYNLSAKIKNDEFSVEHGKSAEISSSVLIDGTIYTSVSTEAVFACSINGDKKIEHGDEAILLCFAEKGEKIWDIAKRYSASAEEIARENRISGEVLPEKTMIIITR